MKKILISLSIIGAVAAIAIYATTAFYSDTETSTGNTFTAGSLDLTIDNTSYALDYNIPGITDPSGQLMLSPHTTWTWSDLDGELFFDFVDLKPGDMGEDTVSLHVTNDAWACVHFDLTANDDVTCTEPELDDDTTCDEPDSDLEDGDLAQALNFFFWIDDGDNVYELDERPLMNGPAIDVLNGRIYTLADSLINNVNPSPTPAPLLESHTYYIGKAWCYGVIGTSPQPQDTGDPTQRPLSITCNGAAVDNAAQTDQVMGDINFYSVQFRHNPNFECSSWIPVPDRPRVGANLAACVMPATCDATVSGGGSIQSTINDQGAGKTICVDSTYDGSGDGSTILLNFAGQTLASYPGQGDATIWRKLDIRANNVTVTGFNFNHSAESGSSIIIGKNTGASGVTISCNTLDMPGGGTPGRGILTQSAEVSNLTITNNVFADYTTAAITFEEKTHDSDVTYNDFVDNNIAFTDYAAAGAISLGNTFTHNAFDGTGNKVDAADGEDVVININNLNGASVQNWGLDANGTLNAENNWWGDLDPSDQVTGNIDYTPFAGSAYPEY